ncbi:MAG: response regulator transcription factor [Anaerolineales bacterium]|nr:response regulator transcription factor [Anaerolineales bacterium]
MRILVADDHSLFRDGIVSLLEAGGHTVIGQARTGGEAVEQALALQPDLVLMDIHMPSMSGLEALKNIKSKNPDIKIVILTVSEEDKDLLEAIRSGANGYLLKHINSTEFFKLLNNLERGEAAILPSIATRLFKYVSQAEGEKGEKPILSDREIDVLKLIAAGKSNRDIANELSISENTIKFHIKNILQKLSVANRIEAVTYAMQHRLI